MELIPVFSLIILVATIGTFILAIGAYVIFRVRESRGREKLPRRADSYAADVFAPEPLDSPQPVTGPTGRSRRDIPGDQKLMQLPSDGYGPGEIPSPDDRRRWR